MNCLHNAMNGKERFQLPFGRGAGKVTDKYFQSILKKLRQSAKTSTMANGAGKKQR
jgi:hypothetical protein